MCDMFVYLQDGVTGEIIALAQGFIDIAELMSKVKGVSVMMSEFRAF